MYNSCRHAVTAPSALITLLVHDSMTVHYTIIKRYVGHQASPVFAEITLSQTHTLAHINYETNVNILLGKPSLS